MRIFFGRYQNKIRGTARIEAWSDAVIAIIITLLVLELEVPELHDFSVPGVLEGLRSILPNLATFAFSFLALAVFWVNHHHFFHELDHADAHLMWYNNLLLFWLALVPFTTAFLGEYPLVPGVVMVYAFVLFMGALSFILMSHHAMFVGDLLDKHITEEQKRDHYCHGWAGVIAYALAVVIAPFFVWGSIALIIFVPIYFIALRLMHNHEEMQ